MRFAQGKSGAAIERAEEASILYRALGDRHGLLNVLFISGYSLMTLAQEFPAREREAAFARVEAVFHEQMALARELASQRDIVMATYGLGVLALHRGEAAVAAEHFTAALSTIQQLGDFGVLGWVLLNLGSAVSLQGDDARAAPLFGRALGMFRDLRDRWSTGHALNKVAVLVLRLGRADDAVRLFGAANAIHVAGEVSVGVPSRLDEVPMTTAIQSALDEDAFAAAWTAGQRLSIVEAIEQALTLLSDVAAMPAHTPAVPPDDPAGLTAREREVVRLLADGLSDREIASRLSISPHTVHGHVANLLAKLGVESRTAAAAFAIRHGLA